jgi:hypothetical protein
VARRPRRANGPTDPPGPIRQGRSATESRRQPSTWAEPIRDRAEPIRDRAEPIRDRAEPIRDLGGELIAGIAIVYET